MALITTRCSPRARNDDAKPYSELTTLSNELKQTETKMKENQSTTNGGGKTTRQSYYHRPYSGVSYWPTPKAFRYFGNEPPANYPIADHAQDGAVEKTAQKAQGVQH